MINKNKNYIIATVSFIICFSITLLYTLKAFYVSGVCFDAPIIANLMWKAGFFIHYPEWSGYEGYYYKTHSSLIFVIISFFSYFLPFNRIDYTSLIFALSTGVLGYTTYLFMYKFGSDLKLNKKILVIITLCNTIFFVFNNYNIWSIRLEHFEIFYTSFIIPFLFFFFTKKYKTSYVFLFLFLITREDFGFHLFSIFITMLFFDYLVLKNTNVDRNRLILITTIAFLSSILACYFKSFFPGDEAFSRVYFNTKWPEILEVFNIKKFLHNFLLFSKHNIYTLVNISILAIYAFKYRAYYLLIIVISIFPWIIIHLLAKNTQMSILPDYYNFPLATMLIWPTLSYIIYKNIIPLQQKKSLFYLQLFMLIVSFGHTIPFYKKIFPLIAIENIDNNKLFMEELKYFKHVGKSKTLVSRHISTMDIDLFKLEETIQPFNYKCTDKAPTIVYYIDELYIEKHFKEFSYKYKLKVKNTPIRILTNNDLIEFNTYFHNLLVDD